MTLARPAIAGVGVSEATQPTQAGRDAALQAWNQYRQSDPDAPPPKVALIFCTSRLDAHALTRGVREILPDVALFGGNANGVISNELVGYDGFQTVVAVLGGDNLEAEWFAYEGVAFRERVVGEELGRIIRTARADKGDAPYNLILLYDSVNRTKGRFVMNLATPLLQGMTETLGEWPNAVGARVMGDMKFNPTFQWCGSEIYQNAAVALTLSGVTMDTAIMHGCRPTSAYHIVTKAEGAAILEIDDRPALEFIGEILGPDLREDYEKYKFFVTLGVNYGEKWAAYQEEHYANRMCVGVVPDRGALVVAEPIPAGTEVQLMRRNFDLDYNRRKASELIERVRSEGRTPFFGLYINCAGRAASYYGSDEEEADYVRAAVGDSFPLLGVYEAGEIARVNRQMQMLDWTGILTILSY